MFHKELMRDRRIYAGLTQAELARRVGVSKQAVQKWEAGEAVPRAGRIKKLSEVLNIPRSSSNNNQPPCDLEDFRRSIMDAVMDMDSVDSNAKIKMYNMVKNLRPRQIQTQNVIKTGTAVEIRDFIVPSRIARPRIRRVSKIGRIVSVEKDCKNSKGNKK